MGSSDVSGADAVLVHPPVVAVFNAIEHADGELGHLGDALGVDCIVVRVVDGWVRPYSGDGRANEDWYGWNEPLLAPIAGTVTLIRTNEVTNQPGEMGAPPASAIIIAASDGTHVVMAHVQDVQAREGDEVHAGAFIARIGNNGMCRNPHVHIGAWRGEQPLQIRFDLVTLGALRRDAIGRD